MRVVRWLPASSALGLVSFMLLLPPGAPILAQGQGTILGTVVDESTGRALAGAKISLRDVEISVVTDSSGIFILSSLPAGELTVRVELPGYVTNVEQVEVFPDEEGLLQFRLGRVDAILEELVARARREEVQGPSVTEVRGRDRIAQTALDLLREQVPGVLVRSRPGAQAGIRIRGSSSMTNIGSGPAIYLNGIRIADGPGTSAAQVLEQIPAERVERIRVLRGPSAAAHYGDATQGVILIETR